LTDSERGYIAGFLDADGSITVNRREYGSVVINFSNTNPSIIKYIAKLCGSKVYAQYRRKGNRRTLWRVQINAKNAASLLKDILPFLKVKKKQAKLAIEFETTHNKVRCIKPTKEVIKKRIKIVSEIRKLNKKNYENFEEVLD